MKVYQAIATYLQAKRSCEASKNFEWYAKWSDKIARVMATAPSGSGIDSGTMLNEALSTHKKLVFQADFHHMNESGMYECWTSHEIWVEASLLYGFDVKVTGKNRNGIKDYLAEVFHTWLNEEAPE